MCARKVVDGRGNLADVDIEQDSQAGSRDTAIPEGAAFKGSCLSSDYKEEPDHAAGTSVVCDSGPGLYSLYGPEPHSGAPGDWTGLHPE